MILQPTSTQHLQQITAVLQNCITISSRKIPIVRRFVHVDQITVQSQLKRQSQLAGLSITRGTVSVSVSVTRQHWEVSWTPPPTSFVVSTMSGGTTAPTDDRRQTTVKRARRDVIRPEHQINLTNRNRPAGSWACQSSAS